MQDIAGDELVKALQIRSKISRRKALSSLEEKVLTILTEEGYVKIDAVSGAAETIPDLFDDEDEDEEVVVDGEVDEGDVHIKPTSRKSTPLVNPNSSILLAFLWRYGLYYAIMIYLILDLASMGSLFFK